MNLYAKAGSDPGLLLTRKQEWGHLRKYGTVNKEKRLQNRFVEEACKNIR